MGDLVQMDPSGKSKGPPPAVKKLLGMFGSGREEDRMVGYLSFLKMGPKLLRFLPGPPGMDLTMALVGGGCVSGWLCSCMQTLCFLPGQPGMFVGVGILVALTASMVGLVVATKRCPSCQVSQA